MSDEPWWRAEAENNLARAKKAEAEVARLQASVKDFFDAPLPVGTHTTTGGTMAVSIKAMAALEEATKTVPPPPEEGQVWVPLPAPHEWRRTVTRVGRGIEPGSTTVSYFIPQFCSCCDTLLRTDDQCNSYDSLDEWNAWVGRTGAVCQEPDPS